MGDSDWEDAEWDDPETLARFREWLGEEQAKAPTWIGLASHWRLVAGAPDVYWRHEQIGKNGEWVSVLIREGEGGEVICKAAMREPIESRSGTDRALWILTCGMRSVLGLLRYGAAALRRIDELEAELEELRALKGKRPGFIYLLRAENGLIKIGRSRTFDKRVENLGIIVPMEVEVIHGKAVNDMVYTEALYHEHFKEKRVKGEWFDLNPDDIVALKSHPGW